MIAGAVREARFSSSNRSPKKVVAKTLSQHLSARSRLQSSLNSGFGANLRRQLEFAVVDRIAHHLACLERRHLGAALADQIFLAEVDAIVNAVIIVRVSNHRLHGVAALLDELDGRGLVRLGQTFAHPPSVGVAPAVTDSRPSSVDPSLDFEWVHKMNLMIVPNPALPQERQVAVAAEHGMTDGRLVFPCRLSLSFYLMSEHNLDVEPDVLKPEKQQIVLQNREEIIQARALARQMSIEALARAQGSGTAA